MSDSCQFQRLTTGSLCRSAALERSRIGGVDRRPCTPSRTYRRTCPWSSTSRRSIAGSSLATSVHAKVSTSLDSSEGEAECNRILAVLKDGGATVGKGNPKFGRHVCDAPDYLTPHHATEPAKPWLRHFVPTTQQSPNKTPPAVSLLRQGLTVSGRFGLSLYVTG
ncbi:MAG: hypothetical protein JWL61_703 [Gemmatimonadetes bacterium]|nr:hypothetical protein [Gemmatimonadota bacterium]